MDTVSVRGVEVPTLGLGTWQTTGDQCYETVSTALELGYRHVDTAQLYENERAVGRAIADSDVDREDVWLTTKVTPGNARYEDVLASSRESLERLDTSYVDLLLLHWPNPLVDFGDTARAMAELRDDGLADNVGVSNFRRWRLRKARERSPVPILADQVRCHPYYTRETLRNECEREEQVLTAYSPLAHGGVVDDSRLAAVGEPHDRSAVQVALRWLTQRANVVAIPKSTSRDHLAANLAALDFELDDEEMARVASPSLVRTTSLFLRNEMAP
jgi:diketogulonate reductase-like aldo/keto reductase